MFPKITRKLRSKWQYAYEYPKRRMQYLEYLQLCKTNCEAISVAIANGTDGLASIYTQALHFIKDISERNGRDAFISYAGNLYQNGARGHFDIINDLWSQNCAIGSERILVPSFEIIGPPRSLIALSEASRLWAGKFQMKEVLHERVLLLSQGVPEGEFLGLHYRGTDKSTEADPVTPKEFSYQAALLLERKCLATAILFSDDQNSANEIVGELGTSRCLAYAPVNSRGPVHLTSSSCDDALEAAAIMILLSRARVLLKTPSALSGWAKVLSPELECFMVGQPKPWMINVFPDCFCDRPD